MTAIAGIDARAVRVPLRRALRTAGGSVTEAPLLLLDVRTAEGVAGSAYLFCYADAMIAPMRALVAEIARTVAGLPLAPLPVFERVRERFRLIGYDGLVASTAAAVDVAVWDAVARRAGLSLARLLGGAPRAIPAYNSNGLGVGDPGALAAEAQELLAEGFSALKLRLGYADAAADVAAVRAVRARVPASTVVMTDYNQTLRAQEAIARGRALDDEGVAWIEEPIAFDDDAGNAAIARAVRTPLQLGENFLGPAAVARAIAGQTCDLAMFDLQRIGGVTGWLRASALAEAASLPVSSHLYPEVSAHLLAVTPTAHWLEYVDWAAPILANPPRVSAGTLTAPDVPGTGIAWDEDAVARYLVA